MRGEYTNIACGIRISIRCCLCFPLLSSFHNNRMGWNGCNISNIFNQFVFFHPEVYDIHVSSRSRFQHGVNLFLLIIQMLQSTPSFRWVLTPMKKPDSGDSYRHVEYFTAQKNLIFFLVFLLILISSVVLYFRNIAITPNIFNQFVFFSSKGVWHSFVNCLAQPSYL